ncbi:MAG: hypothetical protein WC449_00460 [Candidatus Paceibacterota bacterium]
MKIAIVGNLGQSGYIIAKALRQQGQDADLFITCKNNKIAKGQDPKEYEEAAQNYSWIKLYNTSPALKAIYQGLQIFPKYDRMIALTLSPAYVQFFNKNYIAISTGSDLREFVFEKGIMNFLLRLSYKNAKYLFCGISEMNTAIKELRLENKSAPLFTPIDINLLESYAKKCPVGRNGDLTIFAPSSWITSKYNKFSKGIDKLLEASIKLIEEGYALKLKLIDFSNAGLKREDVEYVKNIAGQSKGKIEIIPRIPGRQELVCQYLQSDIIADQFDIGLFGNIGGEALACKKPLLTFFNKEYFKYYKGEIAPIINCQTQEEIYQELKKILLLPGQEREKNLQILGEQGYNWLLRHHALPIIAQKIINVL